MYLKCGAETRMEVWGNCQAMAKLMDFNVHNQKRRAAYEGSLLAAGTSHAVSIAAALEWNWVEGQATGGNGIGGMSKVHGEMDVLR